MRRTSLHNLNRVWCARLFVAVMSVTSVVGAGQSDWQRQDVDWRMTGGDRVRAVRYPETEQPTLFNEETASRTEVVRKLIVPESLRSAYTSFGLLSVPEVMANVIDSPPIAGFIPYIAVTVTDERSDDIDWVAEAHTSVVGRYLTASPETNFLVGLFDTGAGFHLMGYAAATRTGIYAADLLTPNIVEIIGATNSALARVSQPLAVFIDGLGAVDPNGMTLDASNMVGQSNVSIVVGEEPAPDQPDLPTAIGSPMSVNFVTVINNDRQMTVTYDGDDYTSPDIRFYSHDDIRIPEFSNRVPLSLIPAGAFNVQYIPDLDAIMDFTFQPGQPSIIVGNSAQSLFFVESVDLYDEGHSAIDKNRLMLDTGAQITVISSAIGSRLGLNPAKADFEVEIEDATGEITIKPGFYLDSLEIPGLGDWLQFTNVPVILLDVASPEGGTLEGIIGTNLFTEFNLVLRGGGLFGQDPPSLGFERIAAGLIADIAPDGGDGVVDYLDFAAFAAAWHSTPDAANWNPKADMAPQASPDGIVDFLDLAVFTEFWLAETAP
ncbi:MAG: aspartyl protease family protein [Planctomycetota bacterium]